MRIWKPTFCLFILITLINIKCTKTSLDLPKACFIPYIDFVVYNVNPNTLEVNFRDLTSVNGVISSHSWDFGDGTLFTGNIPPKHTYPPLNSSTPVKKYIVKYTVGNECGSSYWSKEITVGPCLANVKFIATALNDSTIQFTNQSTSPTAVSYVWDFNDGTTNTSTNTNIIKVFTVNKTYNVTLKATNTCGENFYLLPVTICRLPQVTTPITNFTNGNTVSFDVSNTKQASTYRINFGNGISISQNSPYFTYTYPATGNYTISYTATNSCGSKSTTMPISITCLGVDTVNISTPTSEDLTFNFSGVAALNATSYTWDFGNMATSNIRNTSVTYSNPGSYTIKYSASNLCSTKSISNGITVPTVVNITGNTLLSYQSVVTVNPNLIYFLGSNGIAYQFNTQSNSWTSLGSPPIPFNNFTKLIKDRNNNLWAYGSNGAARWTGSGSNWILTGAASLGYSSSTILSDIDFDSNNNLWSVGGTQLRKGSSLILNGSTVTSLRYSNSTGRMYFTIPSLYTNRLAYVLANSNSITLSPTISNMSGQSGSIEIDFNNGDIYFSSNQGFIRCDGNGAFISYFNSSNTSGLNALPNKFVFDNRGNIWVLLLNGRFLKIQKNISATNGIVYTNTTDINNLQDIDLLTISSADNDIILAKSTTNGAARIK